MAANPQANNIDSTASSVAAGSHAVADSVHLDSVGTTPANDELATDSVTVVPPVQEGDAVSGGNGACIVGWIGLGVALCSAYAAWKIWSALTARIKKLEKQLGALSKNVAGTDDLQIRMSNLEKTVEQCAQNPNVSIISRPHKQEKKPADQPSPEPLKKRIQVRYATLQSPDENGVLRFSERSMNETPSSEKMFRLEIDTVAGKGTYRVNPSAAGMILNDLQLFREFVKPFNFSGDPATARISDKKPGTISKSGNYWVVDDPLEISIE